MNWYLSVIGKYAVFSGRARRKEYWMFSLVHLVIMAILGVVEGVTGNNFLGNVYVLAVLLPTIGVGIRRMHDIDRTGWWILVPVVNFIFACYAGTDGENRYGPDPKSDDPEGLAERPLV